ncbi:sulfotransferase [Altererythrobacter aurantiacus]|uniref:Sulfotransferase n=1 Tax=Parapontixanthobacter aurantiacus TaxID=1463599 RepID=A0A844ZLJ4_9SPHN|nr:sulfotransferase [Parapontixanthobacter aurantiacus]MXO86549.1 sulfotransferase [Parapontixanthobacter aurantiacus]
MKTRRSAAKAKLPHRYLFVGGLHRSGTSLLARSIAAHPDIAAIKGAPVPENEGCYLQGAIPHTAKHGVPGEFGCNPHEHLTEDSFLNSLETQMRIERDWAHWFDKSHQWRIEKSPVNLVHARLLQALFPLANFVILVRHPQIVAAATEKWSSKSQSALTKYVCNSYRQMLGDLPYLHRVMVLRYEDFVEDPKRCLSAVWRFCELPEVAVEMEVRDGNRDYVRPATTFDDKHDVAKRLGYSAEGVTLSYRPLVSHALRSVREEVEGILEGR